MPASPAAPMHHCAICGQPLANEASIPTTGGETVHIRCADREAPAAARGRTRAAIVWGIALVSAMGYGLQGLRAEGQGLSVVLLLVLLIILHVQLNRRWWHELVCWGLGIRRKGGENHHLSTQRFGQPNNSDERW